MLAGGWRRWRMSNFNVILICDSKNAQIIYYLQVQCVNLAAIFEDKYVEAYFGMQFCVRNIFGEALTLDYI